MEPPAKRLRILQSLQVDETNPEYIAAKEKQKAKLKSKFESIFSKFEALPEAMSDEIDMRTGEIVVDRGHMRKLEKEYRKKQGRRPGQLLDDLIADEVDDATDDEGSMEQDTKDELAPSQSPEPRNRKQEKDVNGGAQAATKQQPQPHVVSQQNNQVDIPSPYTPSGTTLQPNVQPLLPNSASPAANLMQLVQFPQTPAGQLAQSTFMAQITQAVQQAITPIISNLLSSAPGMQPQEATNALPASLPSALPDQHSTPPTAPRPCSPPLPEQLDRPTTVRSSPAPVSTRKQRYKSSFAKGVYIRAGKSKRRRLDSQKNSFDELLPYAAESRDLEPKRRDASTENDQDEIQDETVQSSPIRFAKSRVLKNDSPPTLHHLPTPSSLGNHEHKDTREPDDPQAEDIEDLIASGGHFDEDERELLSLAGADDAAESHLEDLGEALVEIEDTPFEPADNEIILPSIETDRTMEDEKLEDRTSKTTHFENVSSPTKQRTPRIVSRKPTASSSVKKSRVRRKPINFQVDSESEEDLDLIRNDSLPIPPASLAIEDDELLALAPATPVIKRESVTPPASFLLTTPVLHTPRSAPQPTAAQSSGAKPMSSKLARSAFLKKVKQSWATRGRKSTPGPKTVVKRRSFNIAPMKRAWNGMGDSDDELAS